MMASALIGSAALAMTALAGAGSAAAEEIEAPGPQGALHGTLLPPAKGGPLLLIIPGSGPTDRDGNNPAGLRAASYRLLAEALAARGIGSVRIDKRGMFASAGAGDPNAVTIAAYADDVRSWVAAIRAKTGASCIWLAGHSEGGLVALAAAQPGTMEGLCGVILMSTAGRPLGAVMREQLKANPANAPILDQALGALDRLEKQESVDVSGLHPALQALFAPQVQPYLMDMLVRDPVPLATRIALPMLIVQGDRDLQVSLADAEALHAAQPNARLAILPGITHALKHVAGDDRAANMATYTDPALPIAPETVAAIADFVTSPAEGKEPR